MKSSLSDQHVKTVIGFLQGKRLEKFRASIEILRTAEARGAWEGREAQQAGSGFYQGLGTKLTVSVDVSDAANEEYRYHHRAEMCVLYGQPYSGPLPRVSDSRTREVSSDVIEAWFKLCWATYELRKQLDSARPKPVVTAIGLSPKVTKTLTEMDLDIDLPTITPAKIEAYKVQARHPKTGEPLFEKDGTTPILETAYRVAWTPGTKFGKSRFWNGCQACGKPIPSNRYVAIEAECRKNGRIGLWIGCDCAKNIFGIKDKGIAKE